ncbi:MAG: U32 family peptidase [Eubacterium sp.]|nr:U32 family peptidase [Eubacterium sp.]
MDMKSPEILAPAGSEEILYAAAEMGADAIYTGAKSFGARAFAKNLSQEELIKAIHKLHIMDKKLYLTVNTLVYDDEIENLIDMLNPLVAAGLDAVIVQDLGVMSVIHERYPMLPIHASTQMAILTATEIELLKDYGVTRVVPARELSIEEIRKMRAQTDAEIEVFVHGALCVCYSGWCLMSEHIGGRSGNRGACAGPCRLKYDSANGEGYYLNAKDSMTLEYIPELVDAGIDSFKIEGRMKNKYYASYIARLYKHYTEVYLEEGKEHFYKLRENKESVLHKDIKNALDIYNRGGTFPSFLFAKKDYETIEKNIKGHRGVLIGRVSDVIKSGKQTKARINLCEDVNRADVIDIVRSGEKQYEFTSSSFCETGGVLESNIGYSDVKKTDEVYRVKNNHLLEKIDEMLTDASEASRVPARIALKAVSGHTLELQLEAKGVTVSVVGGEVQRASKRPVQKDDVVRSIGKLENTGLICKEIIFDSENEVFFPIGEVKKLRREAVEKWTESCAANDIRDVSEFGRIAHVDETNLKYDGPKMISVLNLDQLRGADEKADKDTIIHMKFEGISVDEIKEYTDIIKNSGRRFAFSLPRPLHGSIEEKVRAYVEEYISKFGENVFGDIFIANSMVSITYRDKYFPNLETYADENLYMANRYAKKAFESLSVYPGPKREYGRIPVMTTRHKIDADEIITPKGDRFSIIRHDEYGYSTIFTAESPKFSVDKGGRIDFTCESKEEIASILQR